MGPVAGKRIVEIGGIAQPAPAPRFSDTASEVSSPPPRPGQHTEDVLGLTGFSMEKLAALREQEVI